MTTNPKNKQYNGVAEITEVAGRWEIEYIWNIWKDTPYVGNTKMLGSLVEANAWCVARGLEVQAIRN